MAQIYLLLLTFFLASLLLSLLSSKRKARAPLPPGPKGLPILGNLLQMGTNPNQTLYAMSRVYGPLLHLRFGGTHVVVACSPSVASLFLKTHDTNFSSRPINSNAIYMGYNAQDITFSPYGQRWRMLRKLCTLHLFCPRALAEFSHIRKEEVASMVHGIAASSGKAVEVGKWLSACTANNLTRAMLGRRLFAETSGRGEEVGEFKEMVVEILTVAGSFIVGDYLPGLHWLDLEGMVARMKRVAKRFDLFLNKVIEEHLAFIGPVNQHKDMLAKLMQLKENAAGDQETVTDTDIKATLVDMFAAGTDTSSSSVEWALTEMIRHPEVMRKAHEELDSVVGRDRLVMESDLPNLTFMQAIIKETFRLHPPTPLSVPRIASESCEINGYYIPKNTTLLVNIWAIGRDPDSWSNPLEFRPERFLPGGESSHVDVSGKDFALIPFGAGRRRCAGMNLGLRIVHLMTSSLVHAFDWDVPMGQSPEDLSIEEAYGMTLQKAVPLTLFPRPRLAAHVYGCASS